MNHQDKATVVGVIALIGIIAIVTAAVNVSGHDKENSGTQINATQAIAITAQNQSAKEYIAANFKVPEWRAVKTTLLNDSSSNNIRESGPVWKVEMMERSCACSSIKDLYVVEGYISADTGNIINLTTGPVLESNYDKATCATTTCH